MPFDILEGPDDPVLIALFNGMSRIPGAKLSERDIRLLPHEVSVRRVRKGLVFQDQESGPNYATRIGPGGFEMTIPRPDGKPGDFVFSVKGPHRIAGAAYDGFRVILIGCPELLAAWHREEPLRQIGVSKALIGNGVHVVNPQVADRLQTQDVILIPWRPSAVDKEPETRVKSAEMPIEHEARPVIPEGPSLSTERADPSAVGQPVDRVAEIAAHVLAEYGYADGAQPGIMVFLRRPDILSFEHFAKNLSRFDRGVRSSPEALERAREALREARTLYQSR